MSLKKFRPGATLRASPCLSISEILLTPMLGRRGNWRYDWFRRRGVHGISAQEACRDWRQGAVSRLHRTSPCDIHREGARAANAGSTRSNSTGIGSRSHLANEAVKVFTRRGNDWTKRFRKIADDAWHVAAGSAIIDGEVVVPSENGTTDFSVLQNELKGKSTKIVLVAFDLLYLNGYDLRRLPLIERKAHLKKIIDGTDIQFSESFEIEGREMFAHACKVGLEGVVSKVRDSAYVSGRGNNWVKKTCAQRETLTIAGFAMKGGSSTASLSAGARR